MAIPTKKEILDFSPINAGGREALPEFRRKPYSEIEKALKTKLIVAITGLRRVGKTTLMKQLLGKDSAYFSFDEKRYANPDALKRVIDVFLEENENPLIALDEIYRVEDWSGVIKKYHDQKLARFLVSGSSSLLIKKGVESLSGRMLTIQIPPLQFDECLELKHKKAETPKFADAFKAKKTYEEDLDEFLIKGSFPEIMNMDEKTAQSYIRTSTIEKIVLDDIPSTFNIEHASKLYDLLKLCATNSSHLYSELNFSEALQISRHAVSDYLFYLSKAFLSETVFPAGSYQKALKKQKKIFVKTASVYNALAENRNAGQAAETAVFDKLNPLGNLSFYRDAQKREVDFISKFPVEVKFQSTITSEDTRTMLYYLQKKKQGQGIVVTKSLLDEKMIDGKKITYIPLELFLRLQL